MGGASLPTVPVGTDGRAVLLFPSGSLGLLDAGAYQVTATYSGDDRYQSSRAAPLNFAVEKAPTTLTLASSQAPGGQATTLKAPVNSGMGIPPRRTLSMSNRTTHS